MFLLDFKRSAFLQAFDIVVILDCEESRFLNMSHSRATKEGLISTIKATIVEKRGDRER